MDTKKRATPMAATCACENTLRIIDGKWNLRILVLLTYKGTQRFGELQKLLPNITQRTLTAKLRELEDYGIVQRKVYPVVPPKVEYSLTELGQSLQPLLKTLGQWNPAPNPLVKMTTSC